MPRHSLQELLEQGFTPFDSSVFPELPVGADSILMAYEDEGDFINRPISWWKPKWKASTGRGKRIAYKILDTNGIQLEQDTCKNSIASGLSMSVFGFIDIDFVLEVCKALRKYDALKDEMVRQGVPPIPAKPYSSEDLLIPLEWRIP